MAGHLLSLPAPALADEKLTATLSARLASKNGRWSVFHVLYQGCACSSRVLSHLIERRARTDVDESVIYAHDADDSAAATAATLSTTAANVRGAGFLFEALTPSELAARYQIESAPLLLVADPQGAVRYAGGYTDRSGAKQISDIAIIDRTSHGDVPRSLPIFGCAVSRRLQGAVDPLGLKYAKRSDP
jgi:hypothetical protein